MSLRLVKHRLPPIWDGQRVLWEPFDPPVEAFVCPPPTEPERCRCGSEKPPRVASGRRVPAEGAMLPSTKRKMGRFGRWVNVPVMIPAWPVVDLVAFRCSECGADTVWDMVTDEWWELGPEDYGPEGSERPGE